MMKQRFGIICITGILCFLPFSVFASTDLIPADRQIDWTYAGIPGGIPNRTTICQTIDPAKYGNGTTDATTVIQTAINNCPDDQVVYLQPGTFNITKTLNMGRHHTLRGAGPKLTILKYTGGNTDAIIKMDRAIWNSLEGPEIKTYPITLAQKDAQVITLGNVDVTGISSGDLLFLNQLNDGTEVDSIGSNGPCPSYCFANGTRSLGQLVEVSYVSGNKVYLKQPLHWTYNTGLTPLAYFIPGDYIIRWSGVEDLTITQDAALAGHSIYLQGVQYSWIKNVEIKNINSNGIFTDYAFQNELIGNYLHTAFNYVNSAAYGISLSKYSTNNLVENNIIDSLTASLVTGPSTGNVLAYNYIHNLRYDNDTTWMIGSPIINHGAHPYMNLWEGNIGTMADGDFIWGSSSRNTIFRSQSTGWMDNNRAYNNAAIRMSIHQLYENAIGNVLGTAGWSNSYEFRADRSGSYVSSNKYIWVLGKCNTCTGGNTDPLVPETFLRYGNFDYYHNAVMDWDPNNPDHTLPASLYLSSKPSWWCQETPWPPIGPDVTGGTEDPAGHVYKIPAQRRFEGLPCTQGTGPFPTPSGTPTVTPPTGGKPGDANGDLKVDGRDYVVWLNNYGQTVSEVSNGNFNGDSVVDGRDYVVWLNNYEK
jgi:hypothetical protein